MRGEAFSDPARREPGVAEQPDRAFTLLAPSAVSAMPLHFPGWALPSFKSSRMPLDNSLSLRSSLSVFLGQS